MVLNRNKKKEEEERERTEKNDDGAARITDPLQTFRFAEPYLTVTMDITHRTFIAERAATACFPFSGGRPGRQKEKFERSARVFNRGPFVARRTYGPISSPPRQGVPLSAATMFFLLVLFLVLFFCAHFSTSRQSTSPFRILRDALPSAGSFLPRLAAPTGCFLPRSLAG